MENETTIQSLENLCADIAAQRNVIDEISKKRKIEDEKLQNLEEALIETLHGIDKTSYQSSAGTFSISHRMFVKLPADEQARAMFYGYLKEKGLFEKLISVNSNTLNSFYREEMNAAKEAGAQFEIPGIDTPTMGETLSFRKAK